KASDGHGGTIIYDPPASASTSPTVSIGGAGNDTFVFHPGEGAQTVNNFNPQQDTIELDHFANIPNAEQLAQLVTPDAHGNAVLELGHGDSIAIPGVSATFQRSTSRASCICTDEPFSRWSLPGLTGNPC